VTATYTPAGAAPVPINLATPEVWTEVGASMPGVYQVSWPDAVRAVPAERIVLSVSATGAQPSSYHLRLAAEAPLSLQVGAGSTPSLLTLPQGTAPDPNHWNRRTLLVASGAAAGERVVVVRQDVDALVVAPPLTIAPASGDWLFLE
jgi:hypothetical protein